jgi:transglutaminase superfamily protein
MAKGEKGGRLDTLVPLDRADPLRLEAHELKEASAASADCLLVPSLEADDAAPAARALRPGGVLVAATSDEGVAAIAGVLEVRRAERLGAARLVQAWKDALPTAERVRELVHWTHERLDPSEPSDSLDPREVLAGGHAWCWGYTIVLGEALRREAIPARWVTMIAADHPRGRGTAREDSHEVLEAQVAGVSMVLDPMADAIFDGSVADLLANPLRAAPPAEPGPRWQERGYEFYATSFWYERVVRLAYRSDPRLRPRWVSRDRAMAGDTGDRARLFDVVELGVSAAAARLRSELGRG